MFIGKFMSFTHLHVASGFSSHYGVNRPELLVENAHNLGFDALAITDRDGLYGAIKHIGACLEADMAPIVGVDLPVLDEDGRVIQLLLQQELLTPTQLPNAVVLMAGGKGSRLRPHTEHCPKPMLPVDGKPMLEILLEQCIANGFNQFYFSVNHLKEQIIDYEPFLINIHYRLWVWKFLKKMKNVTGDL
jgi:hypothetical protein